MIHGGVPSWEGPFHSLCSLIWVDHALGKAGHSPPSLSLFLHQNCGYSTSWTQEDTPGASKSFLVYFALDLEHLSICPRSSSPPCPYPRATIMLKPLPPALSPCLSTNHSPLSGVGQPTPLRRNWRSFGSSQLPRVLQD